MIRTKKLEYQIVDMNLTDEHIVLAVNHSSPMKSTQKDSTTHAVAARIIIKDIYE